MFLRELETVLLTIKRVPATVGTHDSLQRNGTDSTFNMKTQCCGSVTRTTVNVTHPTSASLFLRWSINCVEGLEFIDLFCLLASGIQYMAMTE